MRSVSVSVISNVVPRCLAVGARAWRDTVLHQTRLQGSSPRQEFARTVPLETWKSGRLWQLVLMPRFTAAFDRRHVSHQQYLHALRESSGSLKPSVVISYIRFCRIETPNLQSSNWSSASRLDSFPQYLVQHHPSDNINKNEYRGFRSVVATHDTGTSEQAGQVCGLEHLADLH